MSRIRVGCQTYTWEMLGEQWQGKVTDLLDWISDAGYEGIEITCNMIREFSERPDDFKAEAERRGLAVASFAYGSASGFIDPDAWNDDIAGARKWIEFLGHLPGAVLELSGASHASRDNVFAKLDQAIKFYNHVGSLAAEAGIQAVVHPHSHHGSLLESAEEYSYLMGNTDPRCVGFCPDTGHIVRGGQDLLTCIERHIDRIRHVHLKDATAQRKWVGLGQGLCDYPGLLAMLEAAGYGGWVIAEEESDDARMDGIAAINSNRQYLRSIGY